MSWLISITSYVYICVTVMYAQILYECNFDTATVANSCLLPEWGSAMLVTERIGNADNQPPTAPLSDVTSSLKPTDNGESCDLPYKVNTYNWDMYFCNNGNCPTSSNPNSRCTPGRFGHYYFWAAPATATFSLNTDSGGTNGTSQQCLIYYYYLPKINGIQHYIIVRKQEPGGSNETIDFVTNSSFNGWIKRQASFSTVKPGYKIYFTFGKPPTLTFSTTTIAIDEISVRLGSCPGEPVTQSTATNPIKTTTESETVPTNVVEISTVEMTTTATPEPSIITSTMELNPTTEPNNSYIIVVAIVLPAVLIAIIGIGICIKKCSSKKKISPSAFELNQRPPPPSQT